MLVKGFPGVPWVECKDWALHYTRSYLYFCWHCQVLTPVTLCHPLNVWHQLSSVLWQLVNATVAISLGIHVY